GTAANGVQSFVLTSWSPLNAGLSDSASVQAVRTLGDTTYAAVGSSLAQRAAGAWTDVSAGLPPSGFLTALAGDAGIVFAGLAAGGVYTRASPGTVFRQDSAGIATASILSLDRTNQGPVAAAGSGGIFLKRAGAWT